MPGLGPWELLIMITIIGVSLVVFGLIRRR
jgi:hypothetical protein